MSLKFKRHYHLLLLLVFVVAFLAIGFHDTRIIAYTVKNEVQTAALPIVNIENEVDIFDDTLLHEIQILMPERMHSTMIETFRHTGLKEYFRVDVVIDGVRIKDVGIRLKGNSTLFGLRPRGGGPPRGGPPRGGPRGGGPPPGGPRGGGPLPGGGPPGGFDEPPDRLPYLIKFDEFVPGQRYQGYAELAIRIGGNTPDAALMSEPVSNYVFDAIGLPISQTAYAGVRLNNEGEKLYTIAEHLDQLYIDKRYPDSNGVLYKGQPFADFAYHGPDPTLYAELFEQKSKINDDDLASLIDLLRFVSEATDEEFEREFAQQFDVDAFATYLAANNLVVNIDSLAGMGNNYFLYIGLESQYATLLAWDTNESLGKLAGEEAGATLDLYYEDVGWLRPGNRPPPPSESEPPDGATGEETTETTAPEQTRGPPPRAENLLKKRFLATPTFRLLYEEKLKALYEQIFVNDLLTPKINQYADLIRQANQERDLVDKADFDERVNEVLDFVKQRKAFLSAIELLQATR